MARVLVIDDSDDIRELYELILKTHGFEVQVAENGAVGFARARAWRPDVIVLDVAMPVMDGLELLVKLRSDLAPPIPPVVLCSGFDLTEAEALRRGAVRFLRKPVEPADLVAAVADAAARRPSAEAELRSQRERSSAARQRARDTARQLVAGLEAHGVSLPRLEAVADMALSTLVAYVGIGAGALALVRDDHLAVLAARPEALLPPGFDLGGALAEAYEVVETGSSLLLPDAALRPFAPVSRALGGIRFFAGVPLMADHATAIGVLRLFDRRTHRVDADDLGALQLFGRRGADNLLHAAARGGGLVPYGRGMVMRDLFTDLLDAELRILDQRGGSMELAIIDGCPREAVAAAVTRATSPERLIGGVLSPTRTTVLKRAADQGARATMAELLETLRASAPPRAVGIVELSGAFGRGLGAGGLLHVAGMALDRALTSGNAVRRVVLHEQFG